MILKYAESSYHEIDSDPTSDAMRENRAHRSFGEAKTDLEIAEAEARGFEPQYSDPRTLLLDLDSEADLKYSEAQSGVLRRVVPSLAVWEGERWVSKSGNTHLKLTFPRGVYLDVLERLLLEVCLGGDRKRALFSYARLKQGVPPEKCSLLWKPRVMVTPQQEAELKATSSEPAPFAPEPEALAVTLRREKAS